MSRYAFIIAVVFSTCYFVTSYAGIPEGIEEGLELQIESELDKAVNELVTEKHVCEELWVSWPLPTSVKTPGAITRSAAEIIAKKSGKKFPTTLKKRFKELAEKKYGPFTPGELVDFTLKDGTRINGYLREKGKTDLLVDNRRVKFSELSGDELAHFDPITRDVKVTGYIREKLAALRNMKLEYEYDIRNSVIEKTYRSAGYFMVHGEWVAKRDYVAERLKEKRDQLRARLKPMLKIKLYYDNGLVLYNDEWVTREEAERAQQILEATQEETKGTAEESKDTEGEAKESSKDGDEELEDESEEEDSGGDGGLWD